jgi:hypothetical protein
MKKMLRDYTKFLETKYAKTVQATKPKLAPNDVKEKLVKLLLDALNGENQEKFNKALPLYLRALKSYSTVDPNNEPHPALKKGYKLIEDYFKALKWPEPAADA